MHHSPLRYPGGKHTLSPVLRSIIESNDLSDCDYCEPFAGGAGAALDLLFSGVVPSLILGDKDPWVYSFWRALLDNPDLLCEFIEEIPLSVTEWIRQKDILLDPYAPSTDRGFAFFYLNRTNRSGLPSAGPIGGRNQNGPYRIDARFRRDSLIERIKRIGHVRECIEFHHSDALDLVKKVRRRRACREGKMFFYLDPPYVDMGKELYSLSFDDACHKRLARYLLNYASDLPWVVSYDDHKKVEHWYSRASSRVIDLNYYVHSAKAGREKLLLGRALELIPLELKASRSMRSYQSPLPLAESA